MKGTHERRHFLPHQNTIFRDSKSQTNPAVYFKELDLCVGSFCCDSTTETRCLHTNWVNCTFQMFFLKPWEQTRKRSVVVSVMAQVCSGKHCDAWVWACVTDAWYSSIHHHRLKERPQVPPRPPWGWCLLYCQPQIAIYFPHLDCNLSTNQSLFYFLCCLFMHPNFKVLIFLSREETT